MPAEWHDFVDRLGAATPPLDRGAADPARCSDRRIVLRAPDRRVWRPASHVRVVRPTRTCRDYREEAFGRVIVVDPVLCDVCAALLDLEPGREGHGSTTRPASWPWTWSGAASRWSRTAPESLTIGAAPQGLRRGTGRGPPPGRGTRQRAGARGRNRADRRHPPRMGHGISRHNLGSSSCEELVSPVSATSRAHLLAECGLF